MEVLGGLRDINEYRWCFLVCTTLLVVIGVVLGFMLCWLGASYKFFSASLTSVWFFYRFYRFCGEVALVGYESLLVV